MAWGLDQNTDFWTGNLAIVSHQISQAELKPGDILLNPAVHTLIFAGWTDTSRTTFNMYEESHPGSTAHYVTGASYADYASSGFSPYRLDVIQDSGSASPSTTAFAVVGRAVSTAPAPATLPPAPPIAWTDGGGTVRPHIPTGAQETAKITQANAPSHSPTSTAAVSQVTGASPMTPAPAGSPEGAATDAARPHAVRPQAFSTPTVTGWAVVLLATSAAYVWLIKLRSTPARIVRPVGRHRGRRAGTGRRSRP